MFVKPDFKCCIATEIVTALIGGAMSAGTALAGTALRNKAQKQESELAFKREQQAIREQNQYNSPSAQMARMQAAGLNPNLMYDNTEQGLQDDIAHYQPAQMDNAVEPLGNVGQNIIDSVVGLKDIKNKTAETESKILVNASVADLNKANYHYQKVLGKNMIERLGMDKEMLEFNKQLSTSQANEAEAAAEKMRAEGEKATTEKLIAQLLFPYKERLAQMSLQEKAAMVRSIAQQISYLQKQEDYLKHKKTMDWLNFGVNATDTVLNVIGMCTKLSGAKSMSEFMGTSSPFDALEVAGMDNDFQDFLAGD